MWRPAETGELRQLAQQTFNSPQGQRLLELLMQQVLLDSNKESPLYPGKVAAVGELYRLSRVDEEDDRAELAS